MFSLDDRKSIYFVKLYEQLLSCCNDNVIFPFSFSTNLITYFLTGSKTVCDINNAVSPCGSYSSIMNWLNYRSNTENTVPLDNDVFTFFDNNQVLSRNWRVNFDYKSTVSVITNILHIFPYTPTNFQNIPELSPSSWLYHPTRQEISVLLENFQQNCDLIFRQYRKDFISERLNQFGVNQT